MLYEIVSMHMDDLLTIIVPCVHCRAVEITSNGLELSL